MKVKGLKKAVGDYQRANAEGYYSPRYGYLMFDESDGTLWTDEFYSLGHNSWNEYHDKSIINLGSLIFRHLESLVGGCPVNAKITMKTVKNFIEQHYNGKFSF